MTADIIPDTIVKAAEALISVLEEENRGLAVQDFGASVSVGEMKRAAVERLEAALATMHAALPGDHANMQTIQARLDAAVATNCQLLRSAIDTQQNVVHTVLRALDAGRSATEPLVTYGNEASMRPAAPVAFVMRA